jgi:hypothetical protein
LSFFHCGGSPFRRFYSIMVPLLTALKKCVGKSCSYYMTLNPSFMKIQVIRAKGKDHTGMMILSEAKQGNRCTE